MPAPFWGQQFTFSQPDGSTFHVKGWGNQYHAVFETLDGYTVVKDSITGYYVYAGLAHDGESLVPTAARPGHADPQLLGLATGIRIQPRVAKAQARESSSLTMGTSQWEARRKQHREALRAHSLRSGLDLAPPRSETVGDFVGLCLLVEFPDIPGSISRDQVDDFCNKVGYTEFGNNGSVYDYFLEISGGALHYKNVVAPYYKAKHKRSYYTNELVKIPIRARELIKEALDNLKESGFDFSRLTTDTSQCIYAINVFYAGDCVNNWSQGLWPHSHHLLTSHPLAPGKMAMDYQITNMGYELSLGTFCHENGHMLCDFPALYDYGFESSGVGGFCLMCLGANLDEKNPPQVSGYLKYRAGWAKSATTIATQQGIKVRAGTNEFFIHRKSATEYFLIENRQRDGRDSALPANGLAIWHVDELGDNQNEQMTESQHYECSVVQADGLNELERARGTFGGDGDLYPWGNNYGFGPSSMPASRWWDQRPSGLSISNISASDTEMRFDADVQDYPPLAPGLPTDPDEREALIDEIVKDSIKSLCPPGTIVVRATLLGPAGLGHGFEKRRTYFPLIRDRLWVYRAKMLTLTPESFADDALSKVGDVCDMVNDDV